MRKVGVELVLVALVVVVVQQACAARSQAAGLRERAEIAEAAIPALAAQRDAARAARDSVAREAAAAEARVRAVRGSAEARVSRAGAERREVVRTLRVLVPDSAAHERLDRVDALHAAIVAQKDSVIAAQAEQIDLLKELAATADSVAAAWERQYLAQATVSASWRAAYVASSAPSWRERVGWALVGAGACQLLCPG